MKRFILNVGLDIDGTRALTAQVALQMIHANGFIVHQHAVHESDTEATLVAVVSPSPIDFAHATPKGIRNAFFLIAKDLRQDCIAVHFPLFGDGQQGVLIGPKPWGEFNPSYFLQINGTRLGVTATA